ncbi:MAG: hypothetical protein V7631_2424 [Massilia sp.]
MPLLLAAVCVGLPGCAAQAASGNTAGTAAPDAHCAAQDEPLRAASALPARAATHPEPQRGSVAAAGRLPSQGETASSRAMAAASARDEKTTQVEKNAQPACANRTAPAPSENGSARPSGS